MAIKSGNKSTSGTSTKTVVLIIAGILVVIALVVFAVQFFGAETNNDSGTQNSTQVPNPAPSSYNEGQSSSAPETTTETGELGGERPTKPKGNVE